MSELYSSEKIKTEAISGLGFSACGIVRLESVDDATAETFQKWLASGCNADMHYMEGYEDKRLDPRLLMPDAKTMICLALSYVPEPMPEFVGNSRRLNLAAYARGKDYHDVMKVRMRELADRLGFAVYRVFCDTAPILERYWAVKAGLGWIGRNHQLIVPKAGSMFFLGEIFTDIEVDKFDVPRQFGCGSNCRRCIDACPTGALQYDAPLDARKCLSYLTIENRADIPDELADKMGNCFYGCDRCQNACPWNENATPTAVEEFKPSQELKSMTMDDWRNLTVEDYRKLFKGSAVKRAKYEGLMRNISKIK